MTIHPNRTYTPEEMLKMAQRLRSYRDCNVVAARMLESLASQLAAQEREGFSVLPNGGHMMTMCCCGKVWESGSKPDCACVNQPQSPDQDREVSP